MNTVLFGVLIYVAAQLLVGVLVSRRITSDGDYLLAGRRFGYGMATFSFFATWFGAETCIGSAARIYESGLSGGSADPFGYGFCLLFMGLVFAAPLWRRRLTTLADLFRQRYSPGVERLAVLMMVPTSVFWAAAQIRGFGQVLDASSGIGSGWGIALAAVVAILYTGAGGMRADVITDLIQGIMIIVGLAVLWFALFPGVAEWQAAWKAIEPGRLQVFGSGRNWLANLEDWAVPVCGSVVAQELVARALSTRSPQVARRSALMGGGMYIVVGLIPAFIGLVGVQMLPKLEHPEQVLPLIAQRHLSTFCYILFAGALVSAILSTVDSALLAASSLTTHNLIIPLRPGLSEAGKLRLSRLGVVAFGIVAWLLAVQTDSMLTLVENSSAFGSAGVLVLVVCSLFTKVGGVRSAYAALITGMTVWVSGKALAFEVVYLPALGAAALAYGVAACFRCENSRPPPSEPPSGARIHSP